MCKTKLAYDLVAQCMKLKQDGLCDADVIAAIGVRPSTFYRWLKPSPTCLSSVVFA